MKREIAMLTPAQHATLKPGDVVTVRAVVIGDAGDHLKLRTGDKRSTVSFYAPLEQCVDVEQGGGDVPAFPPRPAFFADLSGMTKTLDALCGSQGRVIG